MLCFGQNIGAWDEGFSFLNNQFLAGWGNIQLLSPRWLEASAIICTFSLLEGNQDIVSTAYVSECMDYYFNFIIRLVFFMPSHSISTKYGFFVTIYAEVHKISSCALSTSSYMLIWVAHQSR